MYRGAYEYGVPDAADDYIPQHLAAGQGRQGSLGNHARHSHRRYRNHRHRPGRGGGGGSVPAGGDDDGGDGGSGLPAIPRRAYFTAMQVGLAGIVMFFMALTSSFLVRKALGSDWVAIALPPVLWFNSLVLLVSSATIQLAGRRLEEGDRQSFRYWWGLTIALGLLFLTGQVIAWRQLAAQGMYLSSNPDSSFFYLLTAAHGLHLAGGILALVYVAFRRWREVAHHAGDGRVSGGNLLAFHGRAVAVSAGTSLSGTVNRA